MNFGFYGKFCAMMNWRKKFRKPMTKQPLCFY